MRSLTAHDLGVLRRGQPVLRPNAFTADQWSLADPATGDELDIVISALPASPKHPVTRIDYRLDGGTYSSLIGVETGTYRITILAGAPVSVQLRAVSAAGPGPWSEAIAITPTATPPSVQTAPSISGTTEIGETIEAVPGVWNNAESVSTVLTVGGTVVASPYTLLAGDDGAAIVVTDTATNQGEIATATATGTATYPVPGATGSIAAQSYDVGEVVTLDAAPFFTGTTGGTWSVSDTAGGVTTIDQSGVVSFDTTANALGTVTVSYTNSGGAAVQLFDLTIAAVPPSVQTAPSISGTTEIGETIEAVPGVWNNAESVSTVLTVGGTVVASPYTLLAGDDGAAIVVTDTATNQGEIATATATGTATYPVPGATGSIAAQSYDVGEVVTLDAAPFFTGTTGGTWSVSDTAGGVTTIDQSGVVSFDTTANALGTVTVSYTNSGGAAVQLFDLTIFTASGGGGTWEPDAELADFIGWRADDAATLTLDGSDNVTAWTSFDSNAVVLDRTDGTRVDATPVPYNATSKMLEFSTAIGRALYGQLPFYIGNASGATGEDEFWMAWVGTSTVPGNEQVMQTELDTGQGRYEIGTKYLHWSLISGVGGSPGYHWQQEEPCLRLVRFRDSGGARTYSAWLNGRLVFDEVTITSGAASGNVRRLTVGARNDSGFPMDGDLQFLAIIPGTLTADDRQRLEGWAKHNLPSLSGVTMQTGTWDSPVSDHPHDAAAPAIGAPPVLVNPLPDLTVYAGVQIDEINLAQAFGGAGSFSVSGVAGLSVTGSFLHGTPAGSGTVTVTATNANGSTDDSFVLTVQAAPATVTDDAGLWSAAAALSPGDSITLAGAYTQADASLLELAALTGDTTATLVGFTDFRTAGLPSDLDYDAARRVAHIKSDGTAVTGSTAAPVHPVFGADAEYLRGPERQEADVPLDHLPTGGGHLPRGLKIETWEDVNAFPQLALNGLRHTGIEHDGHIVHFAEYVCEDGDRKSTRLNSSHYS